VASGTRVLIYQTSRVSYPDFSKRKRPNVGARLLKLISYQ
jgi:hypothetical protein